MIVRYLLKDVACCSIYTLKCSLSFLILVTCLRQATKIRKERKHFSVYNQCECNCKGTTFPFYMAKTFDFSLLICLKPRKQKPRAKAQNIVRFFFPFYLPQTWALFIAEWKATCDSNRIMLMSQTDNHDVSSFFIKNHPTTLLLNISDLFKIDPCYS